ncbi:hypothetical protein CSKR_106590 [Clonorchis sinensis]|uniref:Uncharacterized protein n=1 Tax=Clonorchis sinensis TaxID=79923 RepID=A0A419QHB6_CLOSI|nr:hypothetical protein CSKR_106590 [Clonorchis sinensis]
MRRPGTALSVTWKHYKREIQLGSRQPELVKNAGLFLTVSSLVVSLLLDGPIGCASGQRRNTTAHRMIGDSSLSQFQLSAALLFGVATPVFVDSQITVKCSTTPSASPWIASGVFSDCMSTSMTLHFVGQFIQKHLRLVLFEGGNNIVCTL